MPDDRVLLTTERLELRAFRESDFDLLVDLDSDPEVMRYLTGGTGTPPEVIRAKVLPRFMAYDSEQPAFGYWAAILRGTGEFIGWFAFHARKNGPHDEIEIGYRLRRSTWGRGLATEGAQALVRKGFEELSVRRVVATTYEENLASRRVLEKLGFRLVRRFRPTAQELAASPTFEGTATDVWDGDDLEFVIDAADWRGSRSGAAKVRPGAP